VFGGRDGKVGMGREGWADELSLLRGVDLGSVSLMVGIIEGMREGTEDIDQEDH
jgi:hypothetical protein